MKGYSSFALNFGGIGAAAGNHEAKSMLWRLGEGEAWGDRYGREELRDVSQLPRVEGSQLRFVIELEGPTQESRSCGAMSRCCHAVCHAETEGSGGC